MTIFDFGKKGIKHKCLSYIQPFKNKITSKNISLRLEIFPQLCFFSNTSNLCFSNSEKDYFYSSDKLLGDYSFASSIYDEDQNPLDILKNSLDTNETSQNIIKFTAEDYIREIQTIQR